MLAFFLFRHVGVHALCICLRKVIGACCYFCYLFFQLSCEWVCVCVGARWEPRWGVPWGQAPPNFLSLSRVPQSGEALSPAICLPALGIVIPKYKPVNISLVTATSPPQHTKRKKKCWRRKEMLLAHSLLLSLPLSLCESFSSSSWASDAQWGEKMAPFYLVLQCYLLNKTLLLF